MTALVTLANGLIVDSYHIIGTSAMVYAVWESYAGHSTYRHSDEGVKMGRVGSRELPADLNALRGEARYSAVDAWHAAQYAEAYAAILEVYPEAAPGHRSMGDIVA